MLSKQIEHFLCRKRIHKNKHKYTLSGEDFLLVETFSLHFFLLVLLSRMCQRERERTV